MSTTYAFLKQFQFSFRQMQNLLMGMTMGSLLLHLRVQCSSANELCSSTRSDDQNLDQGAKFCSIFKVLGMRRKWCHCVHLVFLILTVYLLSQTESVWRRYRDLFVEPNRQKFDADCTCPYSPYRTRGRSVQVRTGHVAAPGCDMCHAFLDFSAYGLVNLEVTRVTTGRVTRGT
jgi:hypothetical protein